MNNPPLVLDVSGVAVLATPAYLEWIAGTADYLGNRDFWERRGLSSDDARQIATNFDNLIADIVLRKDAPMTLPIGTIVLAVNIQPDWLRCDGSAINQAEYPELWEALYPYRGVDNIVRTPDLVGRVAVGAGIFTDNDGTLDLDVLEKGGARNHQLTVNEIPIHSHQIGYFGTSVAGYGYVDSAAARSSGIKNTANAGGGQSHNNMQPYTALYYVIKAR